MPNAASHDEIRDCKNCGISFLGTRYNSRYCSTLCQQEYNNKATLARYHLNKAEKKNPTKRICQTVKEDGSTCGTILSKYNKRKVCEPCTRKKAVNRFINDYGMTPEQAEGHWLLND